MNTLVYRTSTKPVLRTTPAAALRLLVGAPMRVTPEEPVLMVEVAAFIDDREPASTTRNIRRPSVKHMPPRLVCTPAEMCAADAHRNGN